MQRNSWIAVIAAVAGLFLLMLHVLHRPICRQYPLNFILLGAFTLAKCLFVAYVASRTCVIGTFVFMMLVGALSMATFGFLSLKMMDFNALWLLLVQSVSALVVTSIFLAAVH